TITVTDSGLTGYAWSENNGWINLSPSESGVKNDGEGNLSGFAWDSTAGWVSFQGVAIDSSGLFHGQAVGANETINFDCAACAVETDWRPESARIPSPGGFGTGGGISLVTTATSAPAGSPTTRPPSTVPLSLSKATPSSQSRPLAQTGPAASNTSPLSGPTVTRGSN